MESSIARWGNSLALRLPKSVASDANLKEGTPVNLRVEDGRLVVRPARPKYKLAELLAAHGDSGRHVETDWGGAEGEEAW